MNSKALREVYLWPIAMGVLTSIGLIVALLEDGLLEDLSIILLCVPVLIMVYFYIFQGSKQR